MTVMAQMLTGRTVLDFDALMRGRTAFDYDDITLAPRLPSTLVHRSDAAPDVTFGPLTLRAPVIGSPMPDVCGPAMCQALAGQGALGILHRFQPVGEEVRRLKEAADATGGAVAAAVGVTDDHQ